MCLTELNSWCNKEKGNVARKIATMLSRWNWKIFLNQILLRKYLKFPNVIVELNRLLSLIIFHASPKKPFFDNIPLHPLWCFQFLRIHKRTFSQFHNAFCSKQKVNEFKWNFGAEPNFKGYDFKKETYLQNLAKNLWNQWKLANSRICLIL